MTPRTLVLAALLTLSSGAATAADWFDNVITAVTRVEPADRAGESLAGDPAQRHRRGEVDLRLWRMRAGEFEDRRHPPGDRVAIPRRLESSEGRTYT